MFSWSSFQYPIARYSNQPYVEKHSARVCTFIVNREYLNSESLFRVNPAWCRSRDKISSCILPRSAPTAVQALNSPPRCSERRRMSTACVSRPQVRSRFHLSPTLVKEKNDHAPKNLRHPLRTRHARRSPGAGLGRPAGHAAPGLAPGSPCTLPCRQSRSLPHAATRRRPGGNAASRLSSRARAAPSVARPIGPLSWLPASRGSCRPRTIRRARASLTRRRLRSFGAKPCT